MPRFVDHEQRRTDIVRATVDVIAELGARGLSFRAVAARLGGSTTLVTHYFPTQDALLEEVAVRSVAEWKRDIELLDARSGTAIERLQNLLLWLVPVSFDGLTQERARINLLSGQILGAVNRSTLQMWDDTIRGIIRTHIEELLPAEVVHRTVELLRILTNGIVLSVVEHPDQWPASRQVEALRDILGLIGLHVEAESFDVPALLALETGPRSR